MRRPALILAAGLLAGGPAAAAEVEAVGLHIGSWHSNPSACASVGLARCNNANPGAFVQLRDGWLVGGYFNSVNRPTVYAGRRWQLAQGERAGLDAVLLVATGYPAAPVVPVPALVGRWRVARRAEIAVSAIPPAGRVSATAVFSLAVIFSTKD